MDNQKSTSSTNPPLEIPGDIRTFLEGILQDAGMLVPDTTMKEEMIKELFARLDNFITTAIINNLPSEHLDAFIKLNEEKKPKNEIEQFLKDKMPKSQEVMTHAFAEFRDLYLKNVTIARNAPSIPQNIPAPSVITTQK